MSQDWLKASIFSTSDSQNSGSSVLSKVAISLNKIECCIVHESETRNDKIANKMTIAAATIMRILAFGLGDVNFDCGNVSLFSIL